MGGLPSNYWRLWASSAASNLADGFFFIALPLLAVRLAPDSPVLVAGVAIAGRLPWLVFVLLAGALADRLDRRRTMRNVQLFRVLVLGGLAALALFDGLSLPIIYIAAFALGIGETLFDTAAQSILPSLVEKDQLSTANSRLYAVELVMNQFVGPPLGGFLIAVSVPLVLGSSLLGYVLAAVGLTLMVGTFRPERTGPKQGLLSDIGEGLRYLFGHRVLRTLAIMVGVLNLVSMATMAVFVLYAVKPGPMGLSEPAFGALMTTMAAGSLVGSFVTPWLERTVGRVRLLFLSVVAMAASSAIPGLTTNVVVIGFGFAVSGLFVVVWNVITVSLRQRIIPDQLLGRVNSAYRLLAWGTQPLGALLGGILAEALGLPAVFLIGGALALTLLFARLVIDEAAIQHAEDAAAPAPA